jgi:hypothetical protein
MSTTESNPRTRALESVKIADVHRAKLAVVYVRQSSPQQVVETVNPWRASMPWPIMLAPWAGRPSASS